MGFVDHQVSRPLIFDHISKALHGLAVAERRRETACSGLTARNFWDLKAACYPHLRFGLEVRRQIDEFSATLLGLAFKRLWELNQISAQVAARTLFLSRQEKERQGIKPESYETMKKYGSERNFRGADGELRKFEEHIWVDKLYRIHIFVHEKPPVVEVGYMGRHLSTIKYPT